MVRERVGGPDWRGIRVEGDSPPMWGECTAGVWNSQETGHENRTAQYYGSEVSRACKGGDGRPYRHTPPPPEGEQWRSDVRGRRLAAGA